jgi:hypothetical protein
VRQLIFIGLVLLLPVAVTGQSIASVTFLPQTFFVGDMVEARVVVRTGENLNLAVQDSLPVTDWVTVHSVTIVQRADGFEVRIVFQPFFIGTRQLPAINLGPIEIAEVSAFVSSALDGEGELRPIRDQVILPGTRLFIGVIMLAIVGIPVVIAVTRTWTRRTVQSVVQWYHDRRPYRRLQRAVRSIQAELEDLDEKSFYIRLIDEARIFLESQYHEPFVAATTGEVAQLLTKTPLEEKTRSALLLMFRQSDLVKFAHATGEREQWQEHLEQLRQLGSERKKDTTDVGA